MPTPEGLRFNPNVVSTKRSLIRASAEAVPKHLTKIDLGLGELPYPAPQAVQDAIERANKLEGSNKYTANPGILDLRTAIAQDIQRRHDVMRNPETDVVVTVGSTEALFSTLFAFAAPGNKVLLPEISYTAYTADSNLNGLQQSTYRLDSEFGPDVESILSQLEHDGTTVIILNSPSNPTGHVTKKETIGQLAAETEGRNVVFISDDIYEAFVYDEKPMVSIASYLPDQTVTVSGVSKTASMTGHRVGWMSGPTEIIQQAGKVHGFMVSSTPTISQYAALPVLRGECDADIQNFKQDLARKRNLMMGELRRIPGIQMVKPEGAFYCFVDIESYGDSLAVTRRIAEETGVVAIPGIAFGEDRADKYMRLSYAADDATIIKGVSAIREAFKTW